MKFRLSPFITPSATPHHLLRRSLSSRRSLADTIRSTTVPSKAKIRTFYQSTVKKRHKSASLVQREVARLAVTEGLLKAQ